MILGLICLACLKLVPAFAFASESPEGIYTEGTGPIEIVVFSDYFCPPCQGVEPYLEEALAKLHRSGARITFVDMPIHEMTPLFARYFLYAANAADSFEEKLLVRRTLFDIAQTGAVTSERDLIQKLRENRIETARLDVRPIFDRWVELINRFAVKSTPTCVVVQPGQEVVTYSGSSGIPEGIDRLLEALPENP
jgi:thiol:disulfide interchange protein DsbA